VNKSQVPIEFSWRAFATDKEENEKKNRLNGQLSQEESEEKALLQNGEIDDDNDSLDSDDSYDAAELKQKSERRKEKAIATLSRKYQGIRKAVEDDPMLFQDEIFTIEPLQGKIWPNTEITCCVTFKP
jgi:hydrocephalus-inducing protein